MRIAKTLFALTLLCTLSSYSINQLYKIHSANREQVNSLFALLPEGLAKAVSLEFSGITSDYLMLKTLTFTGEKLIQKEPLTSDQWQMVYQTLSQVSNLDPRFFDPYLVAAMSLPWEAGMISETNALLEKGAEILVDDYRPYFFLWYINYKFLNDAKKAAAYLEKAATKPGAPPYFATLAARTNLKAGEIAASVVFLKEVIKETNDPLQLKFLKTRLQALQKIGFLEHKLKTYRKQYQSTPQNLEELITKGLIDAIPTDPYGGEFYITKNGRVYTTSKLVFKKTKPKKDDTPTEK